MHLKISNFANSTRYNVHSSGTSDIEELDLIPSLEYSLPQMTLIMDLHII
jgi:hypothetical protein